MNIGGRPYHSWVSFIPPAFETTILFGGVRRGLRHARAERPAAAVSPGVQPRALLIARAQDKFFLAIEADRPEVRRERDAAIPRRPAARERWWKLHIRLADWQRHRTRAQCPVPTSVVLGGRVPFARSCAASAGCRQDMHDAPRYDPLEASAVFPKGSSAQPLVVGTVARGQLNDDEHLYTGKVGGAPVTTFPFAITRADLDRGEERFNIYCSPCHGRTGDGNGMVVQRGYRRATSYHQDRLRHGAARLLLRRHHERLRRDARLPGAGDRSRIAGASSRTSRRCSSRTRRRPLMCRRPSWSG